MKNQLLSNYKGLTELKKNQLYYLQGAFLIGIEIIKIPRIQKYRPHFSLYPLYGNQNGFELNDCMKYPILFFEFFNRKNLQFSLRPNEDINEVIQSINETISFGFAKEVYFNDYLDWVKFISKNKNYRNTIKLPKLLETLYFNSLFFSEEKSEFALSQIDEILSDSNLNIFNMYQGYENWVNNLKSVKRIEFMKILNNNKNELNINEFKIL